MRLPLLSACALLSTLACSSVTTPNVEHVPTRPDHLGGAPVEYAVWTPPDFSDGEELPLVVFLHGGGDDARTFEERGLATKLNEAVSAGTIPRAVIVFPQGDDGFWMNWYDGTKRYEDWIVDRLMPEVIERWHTAACPEAFHVMGVSMGGHGALRFALHRPEAFASVTALSAPIFDAPRMRDFADNRLFAMFIPMRRIFGPTDSARSLREEDFYARWQSARDVGMPMFISWGSGDRNGIGISNRRFVRHMREHEIAHNAFIYDGDHSWTSWTPVIEEALRVQVGGQSLSAEYAAAIPEYDYDEGEADE